MGRGSIVIAALALGCTIENPGYRRDAATGSSGSGTGSAAATDPSPTVDSTTSGPGITGGGETTSSSDGEDDSLPACVEPEGERFDAILPEVLVDMFCDDLLDMVCTMVVEPGGGAMLSQCICEGCGSLPPLTLELEPEGLALAADAEARVNIRAVYDDQCEPRFIEINEIEEGNLGLTLLYAGGRVITNPAELVSLDVDVVHDPETICACDEPQDELCCERPPGEYVLRLTLGDAFVEVTPEHEVEVVTVDGIEYEGLRFRAFRGGACTDRLDLHWVMRALELG